MDNISMNKRAMYHTIDAFGSEQTALLGTLPVISTTIAELKGITDQIDQTAQVQGTKTQGITQTKAAQKKSMADQAVVVGGAVSVLATKTNNLELKNRVNYTASAITRLTDAEATVICNIIHEQGTQFLAEAAPYGLASAALDNLRATIVSFSILAGKRRSSQGTKVAATEDLDKLFAQADALLKDVLDKLMLPFKTSNATLYSQYLNARQVISLGSRRKVGEKGKDVVK